MKQTLPLLLAVAILGVMGTVALAQPLDGPPRPPRVAGPFMEQLAGMGEADIRSLVETVRMVKLSRELGLTDEQTVVLVRQYNEARENGGRVQRERHELMRELRALVSANAPDGEIEQKLGQLIAKDREAHALRLDAFEKASVPLAPAQQARLYLFMGDFDKRMRTLIETARRQLREQRGERAREANPRESGLRRGAGDARPGRGEHGRQRGGGRPMPQTRPLPVEPLSGQP